MNKILKRHYFRVISIAFIAPIIFFLIELVLKQDIDWALLQTKSLRDFILLEIDFTPMVDLILTFWGVAFGLFCGFFLRDDDIHDGHDKPIFRRYNWKGERIKDYPAE